MAKSRALGKGLDSLIGTVSADVSKEESLTAPIEKVEPNPDQPRQHFDEASLAELADSIAHHGVLQPILVRPRGKGYQIVAGERRYKAAKRAGLAEVPIVIRELDDAEVLHIALIENLQRSDLDPIEEARSFQVLMERDGLTQTQVAEAVSKSRSYVANAIRLLSLPEPVQELLVRGLITPGHARAILSVPDDQVRERLAQRVVEGGLTVRQTETLAPLFTGERPVSTRTPTPEGYKRAARSLRETLGAPVRVKQVRGKNKIEIEFKDNEDLSRLVALILSKGEWSS